jgi:hypothetical protein
MEKKSTHIQRIKEVYPEREVYLVKFNDLEQNNNALIVNNDPLQSWHPYP